MNTRSLTYNSVIQEGTFRVTYKERSIIVDAIGEAEAKYALINTLEMRPVATRENLRQYKKQMEKLLKEIKVTQLRKVIRINDLKDPDTGLINIDDVKLLKDGPKKKFYLLSLIAEKFPERVDEARKMSCRLLIATFFNYICPQPEEMRMSDDAFAIVSGSNQHIKDMLRTLKNLPIVIHDMSETLGEEIRKDVRWRIIATASEQYEIEQYLRSNKMTYADIAQIYINNAEVTK